MEALKLASSLLLNSSFFAISMGARDAVSTGVKTPEKVGFNQTYKRTAKIEHSHTFLRIAHPTLLAPPTNQASASGLSKLGKR